MGTPVAMMLHLAVVIPIDHVTNSKYKQRFIGLKAGHLSLAQTSSCHHPKS